MSRKLYPRDPRKREPNYTRRWRVDYENMVYEGGFGASWSGFHRTYVGARIAAWWNQNIASYGGTVTLTDQRERRMI